AIDVPTLKTEQARIGAEIGAAKDRLGDLDANLGEWQEILDLAASLTTRCGDAYAKASDRTGKLFAAVFERLDVKDGRLSGEQQQYRPPFDGVFTVSEFEHGTRVVVVPRKTSRCRFPDSRSTWENASWPCPPAGTRWSQPSKRWSLVGKGSCSRSSRSIKGWLPVGPSGPGQRSRRPCYG
ncbi:MAG: hypothetical protein ACRD0J_03290, partial [Acidimicrobiales bacterium]